VTETDPGLILLVEDDVDDEALMLRALRKLGMRTEVVTARSGEDALDFLFGAGAHAGRDPWAVPRVVLLDLQLPKIDGTEVLRRIRADERTRLFPVVMLTSSREQADIRQCYRMGANSYVRKPVDFAEFSQLVRVLAAYWLLHNERAALGPLP
jgi:two-component system response regulator